MGRTLVAVIAFAGGTACGLLIAQWYARHKATTTVDSALAAVNLGGGRVQSAIDTLIPVVTG